MATRSVPNTHTQIEIKITDVGPIRAQLQSQHELC